MAGQYPPNQEHQLTYMQSDLSVFKYELARLSVADVHSWESSKRPRGSELVTEVGTNPIEFDHFVASAIRNRGYQLSLVDDASHVHAFPALRRVPAHDRLNVYADQKDFNAVYDLFYYAKDMRDHQGSLLSMIGESIEGNLGIDEYLDYKVLGVNVAPTDTEFLMRSVLFSMLRLASANGSQVLSGEEIETYERLRSKEVVPLSLVEILDIVHEYFDRYVEFHPSSEPSHVSEYTPALRIG